MNGRRRRAGERSGRGGWRRVGRGEEGDETIGERSVGRGLSDEATEEAERGFERLPQVRVQDRVMRSEECVGVRGRAMGHIGEEGVE